MCFFFLSKPNFLRSSTCCCWLLQFALQGQPVVSCSSSVEQMNQIHPQEENSKQRVSQSLLWSASQVPCSTLKNIQPRHLVFGPIRFVIFFFFYFLFFYYLFFHFFIFNFFIFNCKFSFGFALPLFKKEKRKKLYLFLDKIVICFNDDRDESPSWYMAKRGGKANPFCFGTP